MPRSFFPALALTCLALPNAAPAYDCSVWNTPALFASATVADVNDCLEGDADPKARDKNGVTPLHFAAVHGKNPAVLGALLDAGSELEARNKNGWTPLHVAAGFNENLAVLAALLDAGADPKARAEAGWTPLHFAATGNDSLAVLEAHRRPAGPVPARGMRKPLQELGICFNIKSPCSRSYRRMREWQPCPWSPGTGSQGRQLSPPLG